MADNHFLEIPSNQPQSPSTPPPPPPPSTPLHLSGFLSGDTIQLQGDTDTLQFSVQFNLHSKHKQQQQTNSNDNHFHFPIPNPTYEDEEDQISLNSTTPSPFITPITNHDEEDPNPNPNPNPNPLLNATEGRSNESGKSSILTRLRSGVLSRATYFAPGAGRGRIQTQRVRERGDVLERVLRRHSFPVRPCSSYAFFVMVAWGVAKSKSFSFGETSKRLGKMWCNLPHHEKKVYEDMALKDNARYKRQCNLLKNQLQNEED